MNDMVTVNYYTIDNKNYIVMNEIDYNNKHYVYLVNEDDSKDILVRSVIGDILNPMESEKEFYEVMKLFTK